MFTRYNYDDTRYKKYLEESTGVGKYVMNVPGPAHNHKYINDPYVRLEKFGANDMTNSIDIDNEFKGLNRTLNRDCINLNKHDELKQCEQVEYSEEEKTVVDQSRATHPAWEVRNTLNDDTSFQYLHYNPQNVNTFQFNNNLNSRILEKDYYKMNQFNRK
tara:strand:+ start:380 stop:859 length:480 start_codon:yes stop_codon:yes gene_type:complete